MESKFFMTRKENIFAAKRNIIDYIWKSANLEGLGVAYPDTEAIFNGVRAPNVFWMETRGHPCWRQTRL